MLFYFNRKLKKKRNLIGDFEDDTHQTVKFVTDFSTVDCIYVFFCVVL